MLSMNVQTNQHLQCILSECVHELQVLASVEPGQKLAVWGGKFIISSGTSSSTAGWFLQGISRNSTWMMGGDASYIGVSNHIAKLIRKIDDFYKSLANVPSFDTRPLSAAKTKALANMNNILAAYDVDSVKRKVLQNAVECLDL